MIADAPPALEPALKESVFLKACRLEKTPYTPVWLMRQAGRYMKEYRAIREKTPFLKICKDPALVCEITVTAQEMLGVDAAILFADILLIVDAFGLGLDYLKGDGPQIARPIRAAKDVEALPEIDAAASLSYVLEGVRQTRRSLKADVPLIGFAGAPYTVASYMIEGGGSKDFERTRRFMHADPAVWKLLMEKIARATTAYLNAQIAAGAQAVQLFDSWAGTLEPAEYEEFAMPYSSAVFSGLTRGVPSIHFGTGTSRFLESFARAGGSVIGVDHRIGLAEAWKRVGFDRAIQGNMDPLVLCSSLENIRGHAVMVLDEARGRRGHIFNLGHGVLQDTPFESAKALVETVHEVSRGIQDFLGQ